jgi:hypothetical protein
MKFFSIPEVETTSLQGYINLPKSEREHTILFVKFYRTPYALPLGGYFNINILDGNGQQYPREEGWKEFHQFVKKQYPIQYFMRESIPTYFYSLRGKLGWWKLKDVYYNNIRTIFHPFNNNSRKIIGRSWKDFQTSIVEVNFAIVRDLVEQKSEYNGIENLYAEYLANPNSEFSVKESEPGYEIEQKWHNFRQQLFNCYKYITVKRPVLLQNIEDSYPELGAKGSYEELYGKLNNTETELEKQDSFWLKWIIDNRNFFWT